MSLSETFDKQFYWEIAINSEWLLVFLNKQKTPSMKTMSVVLYKNPRLDSKIQKNPEMDFAFLY